MRCPTSAFGAEAPRQLSTAATRSLRFFRHWRRSGRSPLRSPYALPSGEGAPKGAGEVPYAAEDIGNLRRILAAIPLPSEKSVPKSRFSCHLPQRGRPGRYRATAAIEKSNFNLSLCRKFVYLILYTTFPKIGSSTQKIQTFSVVFFQGMR